ncbi:CIR protein, partial [Plasmodium chabaudi adami]
MDKHQLMCEFLIEADSYFNGKDVDTQKINKHLTIKSYCSNGGCKTNEDHINALTTYIFKEFKNSIKKVEYNDYDECFLIWLSDKLFKMHLESKGIKDVISYIDGTTLNQAYEKHLKNHKVKLGYWDFFGHINGLKKANLKYMSEFYKLLNNICKTIKEYNDKGAESKKLSKYSKNCLNQYITLYLNISKCKSYLHLLNKLKGIYDDFRVYAIQENPSNNNLATNLKKLTTQDGVELNAARGFKPYHFSNKKCYPPKKKPTATKASKPIPGPASTTTIQKESPGSQGVSNTTGGQLSNQENTSKGSDSNQHKTTNEIGKQDGGIVHKPEQSPDGQQHNSGSKQGNSSGGSEISDELKNIDQNPPTNGPEKQPSLSETKEPSPPETPQETQLQTRSDPVQSESQNAHESKKTQKEGSNHPDGQGDSKNDTKDSGSESGNGDGGANEPGTPSDGTGDPPSESHPPSQGGKSDITNPLNQTGTSTPGGSIDLGSVFREFLLNGTKIYNKASQFIKDNHQKFKEATDKTSDAYNDTVDNLKRVYNASSIYFSGMINSITNQLDQVGTPKSGSSGNKLPQSSDQSKETEDPLPPQPSTPPKEPTQITSPDPSQDPSSDLSLSPPPNPPPISSQPNQSSSQSQSTTLQNQQISQPIQKTIAQLEKSPGSDHISRTPWNIIPTTWNGSGDCKPEVNFMNAALVCCTSEQCNLTGISVTLVLIPIILLIVYKYLSSGWRNELKGKKNMKKTINMVGVNKTTKTVINSSDGKKQMQIIIKSSGRKKQTKKSINSVYGEKSPSLNIYKLMQADPVPF